MAESALGKAGYSVEKKDSILSAKIDPTKLNKHASLSEIEFEKFAPDGRMSISQFKAMCEEKGYFEDMDLDQDELEAAFVRLNTSGSGFLAYKEYLAWWQSGVFDDAKRKDELRYKTPKERQFIASARASFFTGTHGKDAMTREQFRLKCYIAGYCLSDEEFEEAWTKLDKDRSGTVEFTEYLLWRIDDDRFSHLQSDNEDDAYIRQVSEYFRTYDTDLQGFLTADQFAPLYEQLVEAGTVQASVEEVFKQLDEQEEGIIKLNDFVRWYSIDNSGD